jgi:hypothetical protein
MNQRTLIGRLLSPAGFGLVLIFFLLPFLTVSCGTGANKIQSSFTGLALAAGGDPTVAGADPVRAGQLVAIFADSLHPEPLMLLAALAVVAGMAVALVRDRVTHHGASLALSIVACGLLVAEVRQAPSRIVAALAAVGPDAGPATSTNWTMRPQIGFWLSAAGLVLLAASHASALVRATRRAAPEPAGPVDRSPGDPRPRRADAGLGLLDTD